MMLEYFGCEFKSTLVNRAHDLSMGAAENDRKHDDLCVGSMGISPVDQQDAENMQGNDLDTPTYTAALDLSHRLPNSPADKHHNSIYLAR